MKFMNSADIERIHSLFSDYTEVLVSLLKSTRKNHTSSEKEITELCDLFIECLCFRDELDDYISVTKGTPTKSILNTSALDKYEEVFNYLRAEPKAKMRAELTMSLSEMSSLSENAVDLITLNLRTFGSEDGWDRIHHLLFPSTQSERLRQLYFDALSKFPASESGTPKIWTKTEDIALVEALDKYGRGKQGLHEAFMSLHEERSLDEIRSRISTIYSRPKRKKPKNPVENASVLDEDEWSVDDNLLELNS